MDPDELEAAAETDGDDRPTPPPVVKTTDAATLADRWLLMLRDLARTMPGEEARAA